MTEPDDNWLPYARACGCIINMRGADGTFEIGPLEPCRPEHNQLIERSAVLLAALETDSNLGRRYTIARCPDCDTFQPLIAGRMAFHFLIRSPLSRACVGSGGPRAQGQHGDLPPTDRGNMCPRCGSTAPGLHPAVQHEGEVQICPHPWHTPPGHKFANTARCPDCDQTVETRDGQYLDHVDPLTGTCPGSKRSTGRDLQGRTPEERAADHAFAEEAARRVQTARIAREGLEPLPGTLYWERVSATEIRCMRCRRIRPDTPKHRSDHVRWHAENDDPADTPDPMTILNNVQSIADQLADALDPQEPSIPWSEPGGSIADLAALVHHRRPGWLTDAIDIALRRNPAYRNALTFSEGLRKGINDGARELREQLEDDRFFATLREALHETPPGQPAVVHIDKDALEEITHANREAVEADDPEELDRRLHALLRNVLDLSSWTHLFALHQHGCHTIPEREWAQLSRHHLVAGTRYHPNLTWAGLSAAVSIGR